LTNQFSTIALLHVANDPRCIEPVQIDRDFFERQRWDDEGQS
jgi:hypothetical protein